MGMVALIGQLIFSINNPEEIQEPYGGQATEHDPDEQLFLKE